MDLLENYKKTWNNQPEETSQFSGIEIYKMAHSKSSSIVKWIFIIGILEFVLTVLALLFVDSDYENLKKMNLYWVYTVTNTINYVIILYFVVKFYINYKSVSATDNTKVLMNNILKTRKTVRNYILTILGLSSILIITVMISIINNQFIGKTVSEKAIIILVSVVVGIITLGIVWLIYQLLYGILLRKLNRNYKELAKLDDLN